MLRPLEIASCIRGRGQDNATVDDMHQSREGCLGGDPEVVHRSDGELIDSARSKLDKQQVSACERYKGSER